MRHKCLAVFLVSILYFSISGLIMFAEVKDLAKASTLVKVLAQSGIYNKLPQYAQTLTSTQDNPQSKALTQGIAQAIDPKFIQSEIEKNAGPFLAYLNGQQNVPNIGFDLRPFKAKLRTILPDIMLDEIKNLPPCSSSIETQTNEAMPTCLPQGASSDQLQAQLSKANSTQDLINQIPDTYGLQQIKNPDQVFGRAKLAFKIINYGYWISLIVSVLMIIFLILLGLSWWPSILRWVGWGLFLPAASMLLFTFISLALPKILLGKYGSNLDPQIIQLTNPVIEALNQTTKTISLLYSGIITGIGFVLLILSYVLPHPPEPKPPVKQVQPQSPPASTPAPTK
ncbi:MAG: hypothetical protein M1429_02175 [Patescibacteria group bacterium]|nr:hypothetical protein [Patescibacteria group bacterium]